MVQGSILNQYSNYTGTVAAPTVTAGQSVSFSVQGGTCGGNFGNKIGVYIDYNRNGTFEANETAYVDAISVTGPHTVTGTITIPANAAAGVTLLRVVVVESSTINPTGTYTWGETEDYVVNILGVVTQNPAYNYAWSNGGSGFTTNVNPSTNTSYNVVLSDPNTGCNTTSSNVSVTVTPVGASATASPATPVCAGTTVTLNGGATGGGPFTYSWSSTPAGTYNSTASITVNPTVTTTYTVIVPLLLGGGRSIGDLGLTGLAAAHGRWIRGATRPLGADTLEVHVRTR